MTNFSSRKVGRPKKNSPPSSTSGSFGSLQALPIKPKKTSTVTSSVTSPPTNFQRQFSSNNSNAVKRHHSVPSATNGFRYYRVQQFHLPIFFYRQRTRKSHSCCSSFSCSPDNLLQQSLDLGLLVLFCLQWQAKLTCI